MRYLSLFSGVEAATVAWHSLGWAPVAFSEIEPFCNAVLAQHYPDVPNLGDISHIKQEELLDYAPFNLVVFGSPCQDLSVAGKRAGLNGEKSGLFSQAIRLVWYARRNCGCRFVLWENVPGVFSSQKGQDFAEVLRLFTGSRQNVPDKGWKTGGVAWGPNAMVEWRTLDAQYFGVPQRRRRVFLIADFGDWLGRSPVLFESEGLQRDSQASKEKRQDVAGPLEARTTAGGFPGTDGACANHVIPVNRDIDCTGAGITGTMSSKWSKGTGGPAGDKHYNLVTIPIHDQATRFAGKRADKQDGKGNGLGIGQEGDPMNTLSAGDRHAVCFQQNQREEVRLTGGDGQTAGALAAQAGMKNASYIAGQEMTIRRLTPMECERLQGFPDNWTRIPWRNKPEEQCPDGPRYKALGNSMAVPVMNWIGRRLQDEIVAHAPYPVPSL